MAKDVKRITVMLRDIEKLTTATNATKAEETKDKDGNLLDRRIITKVSFECEAEADQFADLHRLLVAGCPVYVVIASPQAMMNVDPVTGEIKETATV
jgi:hypothetical protein